MSLKFPITAKLSLLIVLMVVVTAITVNQVYLRASNRILVEQSIKDLEDEAESYSYPLSGVIAQLKDDVRLLSQIQAMQGLVRAQLAGGIDPVDGSTAEQWAGRLNTMFIEMLQTREHYVQARLIGVEGEGREIIKVKKFGNQITPVPENKLQSKGGRTYVQETFRLGPGSVYLSEAELNRENGEVSEPHLLVLRAAVPIYTQDKEVFGIVIINMDLGYILKDIKQNLSENRLLYVTNSHGDYLVHPDASMLYATDLGHDERFQKHNPQALGVMDNKEQMNATFLPENTEGGDVLVFRKYTYDNLNLDHYMGIAVKAPYNTIVSKTKEVRQYGLLLSLLITVITAFIAVFLLRLSMRPLNDIARAVVSYRKGEKNVVLPEDSPDEIGVLAGEFREMINQKNEEDWIKQNLVEISQSVLGFRNLNDFANMLMEILTNTVGAQVGVLYISSSFGAGLRDTDTETLSLLGVCGYKARQDLPQSFHWGEGLVGQCAKDRKTRLITDIPDDYLTVASALGESKPNQMLLLPVLFENSLVGVIELASLNVFTEIQRSFLEQISFNVGVIINAISARMRTEELLEEARQQAEELQRNEEELKAQQEELEASNEEMEEKTKALEAQNTQIKQQSREIQETKKVIEDKARELEQASRYKSEFLANMSHELRTPLNSLLILARSLASNEEGNLTEEQVEEAQVIHNGGLELLSLINDILDLSKVEAGKLNIVTEDMPLEGLLRKLEQQFDPIAGESGVALHIEIADDLPVTIRTDIQRTEQILKNLLSNAFKFTASGGVTLRVFQPGEGVNLQRDTLKYGDAIAFSVIDTGIGIEESKLNDIFEAFQQEDGSIDRHYGGTGLGLTIARKFAHMLGGEIHVASKKNEGSTFTLILPMVWDVKSETEQGASASQPVVSQTYAPQNADHSNALKPMPKSTVKAFIKDDRDTIEAQDKVLLVIEDDKNFARTLMKIANKRGYKCLAAGDGKTGVVLASEQAVDAIILDLTLPDIDGLNVLDQLKSNLKTRHIPVHIITGRAQESNVVPLRKGAIGYLTKPVASEDIENAFGKIEGLLQSEIKKILVVEDDKKTQKAIQSLLKKKDVEITCTGNGKEALKQAVSEPFDCVILDLSLPDMTGFEWLENIEKQAGEKDPPPVIVYTARDLTEEENRQLNRYTGSIVIKGASSSERLLDEVMLFLHSVESTLTQDQQALIRMQHDPDKVLQGRKVLLVDDDMRNTFALSKLLKKHGMNVIIADNGQMALEKLDQEKAIELVIMDIMMPVMDGYQAMHAIRTQDKFAHLPVIALTARAMPEEQDRCIEAGANDYLVKPVDVERLLTLMRVWLFRQNEAA